MIYNKSANICIAFLKILKKKNNNKTVSNRVKKAFIKLKKDLKIKKKATEANNEKNINSNVNLYKKLINFYKKLTKLNKKFIKMCRDVIN